MMRQQARCKVFSAGATEAHRREVYAQKPHSCTIGRKRKAGLEFRAHPVCSRWTRAEDGGNALGNFNGGWHQWFVSPNEEVRFFPWPMLTDRFRRTSGPVDELGSTRKPLLASPATRPTVAELGSGP